MTGVLEATRATPWAGSSGPWFDAELVAQAVAQGHARVVIRGMCFTIERGRTFSGQASGLEYELALLRRDDGGFAPMGYVRLPAGGRQPRT